jgi:acetyltransferase-like isoleucine patch superfamily enzyme
MRRFLARVRGLWYEWKARLSGGKLRIGHGLMAYARLDIRGPGRVAIGTDVVLGRVPGDPLVFVTIYTHAPDAVVHVGDRARLYGARISCKYAVSLGEDVLIEDAGITDTDFHALAPDRGEPRMESLDRCRITIGDRAAVASGAIIRRGASIGHDAVVGPGAVVVRGVPPGAVAIGNPASTRPIDTTGGDTTPGREF